MAIIFDSQKKLFTLETANTAYQFAVDKFGVLKHLWYGTETSCDMSYLLDYHDAGFSGNVYDAGEERSYSHDTLPQEYPSLGTGDYRITAASVTHSDGSCALDLRYESHKIYKGKYSIEGLPAVYAELNSEKAGEGYSENAETLEVVLKDRFSDVRVVLKYGVLPACDIITRSAVFENCGKNSVTLNNAVSLCLDFVNSELNYQIDFYGRHNCERIPQKNKVAYGIKEIASTRGASSHQHNPAVILCGEHCTETQGECVGALLVYSGSFSAKIERDQMTQIRLVMGINPEQFSWQLKPGEKFSTPEVILSYSQNGFEKLSQNFHNVIRNNLCRGKFKTSARPVLINNWEATYFDFNEEKLFAITKESAALGIDMLVIDDGWFGKRDCDKSGLGDWFVNEKKIKGGLCALTKKIAALGMKTGIWFEPEMISEDSELYRKHPEYAIKIPNRAPIRSRHQLVLDMSRRDVRDYLFERICDILDNAEISYIKWDFNRSISDWYSANLAPERMGELPHRYVLGLYELLERLTAKYPDVLFEGCSGGGGRFDAGMLYYTPQIWCSDDTDAYERTLIQYGTSFFYPISVVGSHVSAVPNHQTGRVTSIEARAVVAMAGSFGYELDPAKLSSEEKIAVREQVVRYKKYQKIIQGGGYYRLSNPLEENFSAWEFVSQDKKEILIHALIFKTVPNSLRIKIKLRGLDENKNYRVVGSDEIYSGSALMNGGLLLPRSIGDYFPIEIYLIEV